MYELHQINYMLGKKSGLSYEDVEDMNILEQDIHNQLIQK